MFRRLLKDQKGVSLVLLALSIVVLFGFAALAIDIGHLYHVKNQLQVAADASALAACANLNGDDTDVAQLTARYEGRKIAALNFADVAEMDVAGLPPADSDEMGLYYPGAASGDPLPVYLQFNKNNSIDGDLVVGNYADGSFTEVDGTGLKEINAVMVRARRTAATPQQPRASNWFAGIFALVAGGDYDVTNITSTAIAASSPGGPLKIMPIAVNEYWADTVGKRAYKGSVHDYPNSFVREYQVAGIDPVTNKPLPQTVNSEAFRNTFAILGQSANSNQGSTDPNGFVAMDYRSNYYYGAPVTGYEYDKKGNIEGLKFGPPSHYHAEPAPSGTDPDCPSCTPGFTPGPFTHGNATNEEGTVGVNHLVNGYPENKLPPLPVYEFIRNPINDYPNALQNKVYNDTLPNEPSDCSYATLFYYSTSGKDPLSKDDNMPGSKKKVVDYFPEGSRFMAMVYDGTHAGTPKHLTVVGYVPIEVDGYQTGANPPDLSTYAEDPSYANNKSLLDPLDGNTMYGHALSDIIQPDPNAIDSGDGNPLDGYCDFLEKLRAAQREFAQPGSVKLVHDPNYTKYGLIKQ